MGADPSSLGQLLPAIVQPLPGPRSAALVDTLARHECPALTARRARRAERAGAAHDPIVWTAARDCNVVDADGNVYVDLSAGFGAAGVGHGHPAVVAAVQRQSETLMHALGDLHPSEVKVRLLSALAALAPCEDAVVILGLHGGDAVEAALKTAMLHTGRPGVLALHGGYHGLSHGPLAICGYNAGFRAPFAAQLNPHVGFAPYPAEGATLQEALAAVEAAWPRDFEVGALVVEPVLGRGGVVVPPAGFVRGLSALCRARGALLIADEVMTGCGRASSDARPFELLHTAADGDAVDLWCLGKGLGGGVPVSACLGRRQVMAAWADSAPGAEALHTATFFGHPLGAAAARATLGVLQDQQLSARALRVGAGLRAQLSARLSRHAEVTAVRGQGLLVGVELSDGARALQLGRQLLERGYITVPAGADARVISLTPPLTIGEPLLAAFVETLDGLLAGSGA